jgi:hypothetical protein
MEDFVHANQTTLDQKLVGINVEVLPALLLISFEEKHTRLRATNYQSS